MHPRASDQRRSTRSFYARQRGPHCTSPCPIAASLAAEMRRRSPSVENPPLPARTEGTSSWINPCTSHERRTCLLSSTFHTVHAQLRHYARGQRPRSHDSASVRAGRTPICAGHRGRKGTSRFYPHTRILPNMAWSRYIGLCTCFVQRGRRAGRVSRAVKNTIRAASYEVFIRMPF